MDVASVKCLVLYELENYPEQWRIQEFSEEVCVGGGGACYFTKKMYIKNIENLP